MPKVKRTPIFKKTFDRGGDFAGLYAAQGWCSENGYSYGRLCRDEPIGIMKGDFNIGKWKNLSKKEQKGLDGTITSRDFRNQPVTITLYK